MEGMAGIKSEGKLDDEGMPPTAPMLDEELKVSCTTFACSAATAAWTVCVIKAIRSGDMLLLTGGLPCP